MRYSACEAFVRRRRPAAALAALFVGAAFWVSGCGSDEPTAPAPPERGGASPNEVLDLFQEEWRARVIVEYVRILADDYRFVLDPNTRDELGVEWIDAEEDSTVVARLFTSVEVTKIAIELVWPGPPVPSERVDGPGWVRLDVHDVFLDVDFAPAGQEVTTFRVEDQTQRFHFRRGITPGDSLPESPTSERWFLVEWQDFGVGGIRKGSGPSFVSSRAEEATSWSLIKFRVR